MLTKIMFGLEMEGSWKPGIWDTRPWGIREVKSDGSLTCDNPAEVTTYPLVSLTALEKLLDGLKDYYLGWNSSCGFHVHVSVAVLTSSGYERYKDSYVTDPALVTSYRKTWLLKQRVILEYNKIVHELVARFPELFYRLDNTYCEDPTFDELGRSRYQAINLLSVHGTIEFRIFPANELNRYYEYVEFLVKYLEKKTKNFELSFSL